MSLPIPDTLATRFWERKRLEEMSSEEWEALCDGCGKCCVLLLEDDDTGDVWETGIACQLFDQGCRRCSDYADRQKTVPGCVQLSADNIEELKWMPRSCAYRRLAEGRGLPGWHPLVTGDAESTAKAGKAVQLPLAPEQDVAPDDYELHIIGQRIAGKDR